MCSQTRKYFIRRVVQGCPNPGPVNLPADIPLYFIITVNFVRIQIVVAVFWEQISGFRVGQKKENILLFINSFSIAVSEILKYASKLEITEIQNHTFLKQIFTETVSSQPQ